MGVAQTLVCVTICNDLKTMFHFFRILIISNAVANLGFI